MKNDEEIIASLLKCELDIYKNTQQSNIIKEKDYFGLWKNDDDVISLNQTPKLVRKSRRKSIEKEVKFRKVKSEKFSKEDFSASSKKYGVLPQIKSSNSKIMQYMKNGGVTSYEQPSWRFIVNKTYNYIERGHPKELLRNLSYHSRSKSSCHGFGKSKNKLLDPAAFLDEKMASAYKVYNSYSADRKRLKEIKAIYASLEYCTTNSRRLFTKNALLEYIGNERRDDDDMEEETAARPKNLRRKSKKNIKGSGTIKESKKKIKEKKLKKKTSQQHMMKVKEDKQINFIKKVGSSEIFHLKTIESSSNFMKGPNKIYNTSVAKKREMKNQLLNENISKSNNSYLPTLNFSNYSEYFYVPPKFESKLSVKLPEIEQGDFMINQLQR